MPAYYNEIDPYAAQWLRNLIAAGHIAPGDVDERSIVDVRADDLRGYRQCHFFAGVGVWSYALRKAGWSDEDEVWTGSCPCQPFSAAGKGEAFDDERDLWPAFFALIRERRPVVVAGEQVASSLGLAWLDALHADLEGEAYTVGAVDTCSAGVGSPNVRQRIYWVGHASDTRSQGRWRSVYKHGAKGRKEPIGHGSETSLSSGLADPEHSERRAEHEENAIAYGRDGLGRCCDDGSRPGPTNGFWRAADWLCCTDGKWRPVESGSFPLATGTTERMGRLRAYGNAINAEAAIEFLRACRGVMP